MKAQENKSEKENRTASLKKKLQHDHESLANIDADEARDNGYGGREYENDVEDSDSTGNQKSSQQQSSSQLDDHTANYQDNEFSDNRKVKKQGLNEDGTSFGGSSFSNGNDHGTGKNRDYSDHETINAQRQQTQHEEDAKGVQSDHGTKSSNDVVINQ